MEHILAQSNRFVCMWKLRVMFLELWRQLLCSFPSETLQNTPSRVFHSPGIAVVGNKRQQYLL